jgi:hypothetical protein
MDENVRNFKLIIDDLRFKNGAVNLIAGPTGRYVALLAYLFATFPSSGFLTELEDLFHLFLAAEKLACCWLFSERSVPPLLPSSFRPCFSSE